MPVIEIPSNIATVSVEKFPEKVVTPARDKDGKQIERAFARSCEGALYLRPGVKVVTADELAHLKAKEPKLYSQIRVVALTKEEREEIKGAQKKSAEPKAEPKVETPAASTPGKEDKKK